MTTILETAQEMLRLDGMATVEPWIWRNTQSVKLVSPPNGQCTVIDFVRKGMQSAQPRFSDRPNQPLGGVMHTADEIGDLNTNPDAAFIAFSRAAGPALAREVLRLADEVAALRATVTWRQLDYEDGDTWECLGCGTQSIWEDAPEECDVKYCSYCGHPVRFEPYEDPGEDDELPAPPEDAA